MDDATPGVRARAEALEPGLRRRAGRSCARARRTAAAVRQEPRGDRAPADLASTGDEDVVLVEQHLELASRCDQRVDQRLLFGTDVATIEDDVFDLARVGQPVAVVVA